MSWQGDIYQAAIGASGLSAVIGTRFYWDIADGSAVAPYIVAQEISDSSTGDLSGSREISFPLIQLACWATSKSGAVALAKIVKDNLEGVQISGSSGASLNFTGCNSNHDAETKLFAQIIDYRVSTKTN